MRPSLTSRTPLLLVLALLGGALGCGRSGDTESASVGTEPVRGGTLTVAVDSDPGTLNPVLRSTALAGNILGVANDGLVRMNTRFEFEPVIARRWIWDESALTLTYHLHAGVRWSDGEPMGARDVEATYRLYANENVPTPRRSDFEDLLDVVAVDDTTVVFHFARPSQELMFASAFSILPAHVIEGLDVAEIQSWEINRRPVTCGAYRVVEWASNDRIVLERNPHYWKEPAHLDRIVFKVVPEEAARLLQLEIGEVDMVEDVPQKSIERLRDEPGVVLHRLGPRNLGYLVYNLDDPMFADARVRNAISYAIDRRAFIDGLLFGFGGLVAVPLTPLMDWAYADDLPPHTRDVERSRALLAAAGWTDTDGDEIVDKDGVPMRFEVKTRTGDPVRENGVLILKSNLRAVGIDITPRMLELSTVLEQVRKGEFDVYMGQMSARLSPDLSNSFATDGGWNFGHYSNAELDTLLARARATLDRDAAAALWRRVQAIVYADQPMTMLYVADPLAGIRAEVKNATPNFLSPYEDIHRWWKDASTSASR